MESCHYCGVPLATLDDAPLVGIWCPDELDFEHCGCGRHDVDAGEPCVRPGGWLLPAGVEWATTDHRTPRVRGGVDDGWNVVYACLGCNSAKRGLPYLQFVLEGSKQWPAEAVPAIQPSWGLRFLDGLVKERSRGTYQDDQTGFLVEFEDCAGVA